MTDVDPMDDLLQNNPLLMIRVVPDSDLTEEDHIASESAMRQLSEAPNREDMQIQVVMDPGVDAPDLFED